MVLLICSLPSISASAGWQIFKVGHWIKSRQEPLYCCTALLSEFSVLVDLLVLAEQSNRDMNNWDRKSNKDGCPFYYNRRTRTSQWEHPYFAKILTDLDDYNEVIYAAYRVALKLLHIRNNMHLQSLRIDKLSSAFSTALSLHAIKPHEQMTMTQLDTVMNSLYIYCDTSLTQKIWSDAMSSCLLYFFDSKRVGKVNALGVLIFLTFLCSDKLLAKYTFIFNCLCEHDLVLSSDVSHLKKSVYNILNHIKEEKPFKNSYEGSGTTMTKDMFLKWLFTEPKFIVWLSTLHRIHAAITVRHDVKCYVCKEYPMVGLRYRCLQCFNCDLCFQCFTRIPAYGKHDKSHSIEEYCVPSKKMQDIKAFITKCKNHLKKKPRQRKSSSSYEVQLTTSTRQPATVWHDPRLTSDTSGSETEPVRNPSRSFSFHQLNVPRTRSNSPRARSHSPRSPSGFTNPSREQVYTPRANSNANSLYDGVSHGSLSRDCSMLVNTSNSPSKSLRYSQSLPRRRAHTVSTSKESRPSPAIHSRSPPNKYSYIPRSRPKSAVIYTDVYKPASDQTRTPERPSRLGVSMSETTRTISDSVRSPERHLQQGTRGVNVEMRGSQLSKTPVKPPRLRDGNCEVTRTVSDPIRTPDKSSRSRNGNVTRATSDPVRTPDRPPERPIRISYQTEYDHSPHYSARVQYNRNRELYAPARGSIPAGGESRLNFYQRRKTARTNTTSSEDEGIVVNSESDSGSQYARVYASNNSNYSRVSREEMDFSKHTWDRTLNTTVDSPINYTSAADISLGYSWITTAAVDCSLVANTSYVPTAQTRLHSSQSHDKYKNGVYRAVEGVREAMSPMMHKWQV